MTNREESLTNGPVELGAPTLTINPPAKSEDTSSKAAPAKEQNDAANKDQPER